ncbi:MAG: hypothetical protein ABI746_13495, partial [Dermatophilaceae bacterium]
WKITPDTFQAQTVCAVITPAVKSDGTTSNPLDRTNGGATEASTLALTLMSAPDVQDQVEASTSGSIRDATNSMNVRTSAPERTIQISLTTEGASAATAIAAARATVQLTDDRLQTLQTTMGVPVSDRYRLLTIVQPTSVQSIATSKFRAAGGLAAGTFALGFGLVLGFQLLRQRRATRTTRRSADVAQI